MQICVHLTTGQSVRNAASKSLKRDESPHSLYLPLKFVSKNNMTNNLILNQHSSITLQGNAVILWAPGAGKTTVAQKILDMNPGYVLVHTDEFSAHWYEQSLYALMDYLKTLTQPFIVEWVLWYRLLRKWVELGTFYPAHIITVTAPESQIAQVYLDRGKDYSKSQSMHKRNTTIWNGYMNQLLEVPDRLLPTLHTYDNEK